MKKQQGVTLIELIIAIAIIGILVAFALPAYQEQTKKSRRADGQAFLLQLQAQLERYHFDNNAYPATLASMVGYDDNNVLSPEGYYRVSITGLDCTGNDCDGYELDATAQGPQSIDGNMELHSNGTKLPASHW